MKKLILLLALPLLLANCVKEHDQPEGPSTVTTTYKGTFTKESSATELMPKTAVLIITENSATDWSLSFEVQDQAPQTLAATKNGTKFEFFNQTYLGASVNGKGDILSNGDQIQFFLASANGSATTTIGTFVGTKQ